MGIYIPNMERPESCWQCYNEECDHWGEYGYDNSGDCPLIEIDLVRCGECKYIYTDEGVTLCGVWGKYAFKDGFCYQGERRADGDI